jgi:lysophospholipase L1-like esterase
VAPFQPILPVAPVDWSLGTASPAPSTFAASLNSSTVFQGDSITAFWPLPVHNVGIAGETTDKMLSAITQTVLGQGFTRMVLLGGTNDILYPDAASPHAIASIASMAQIAQANGIQPVLCLLPPLYGVIYETQIVAFNESLKNLAATKGYLLVDYYTPLAGHPEYFRDGVHPNASGYAIMESVLSSVVTR